MNGQRLAFVDDGTPAETGDLLAAACAARGIGFDRVAATGFAFDPAARLPPGSLLYRGGVSLAAERVEQFLHGPGVATFHADPQGPFFLPDNAPLLFQRHGLPVPRQLPLLGSDRDVLRAAVQRLGGLPLVVKLGGGEGGIGTIRVDSLAALFSLADYLLAGGKSPSLCAYVPEALHWRVVVVGGRAVAAYPNPIDDDDFRSHGTDDAAACTATPDPALAALAVAATAALRLEFAGVDLLAHASGRLFVLEANFPCYFAHAELLAGIPIAAAMVDHLAAKADQAP